MKRLCSKQKNWVWREQPSYGVILRLSEALSLVIEIVAPFLAGLLPCPLRSTPFLRQSSRHRDYLPGYSARNRCDFYWTQTLTFLMNDYKTQRFFEEHLTFPFFCGIIETLRYCFGSIVSFSQYFHVFRRLFYKAFR